MVLQKSWTVIAADARWLPLALHTSLRVSQQTANAGGQHHCSGHLSLKLPRAAPRAARAQGQHRACWELTGFSRELAKQGLLLCSFQMGIWGLGSLSTDEGPFCGSALRLLWWERGKPEMAQGFAFWRPRMHTWLRMQNHNGHLHLCRGEKRMGNLKGAELLLICCFRT